MTPNHEEWVRLTRNRGPHYICTGLNLDLIKNTGFEPKNILDIGANLGFFYKECESLWPDSEVAMIEATRECEPYLMATGGKYTIAVLSDTRKEITFYKSSSSACMSGNSVYLELTTAYSPENLITEKRETVTLDDLHGEDSFDLIKIDTQGSEIDIMNGGHRTIKKARGVIIEVSDVEYNKNSPTSEEVINYMDNLGFSCNQEIGNSGVVSPWNKVIQRDLFFTKT